VNELIFGGDTCALKDLEMIRRLSAGFSSSAAQLASEKQS
jgi:hypothetical protein